MAKEDVDDLKRFLAAFPASSQEIALELRDWVWGLYPKCNELIYDNYNFLALGWAPTMRMGDIFCSIAVGTRGVMFGFLYGVDLDDPENKLSGSGNQFRSLRVPDTKTFPRGYVKNLLKQAFGGSVSKLKGRPQEPNGVTIVKSISPTKRRPGMASKAPPARRELHQMPDFVLKALKENKLFDAYEARPPYQKNDYIGWVSGAKRDETRGARLAQMLDELRRGDVYMKMAYRPKSARK